MWFEGVDDLPLLVKFLFTTEKLSVQVHPDDEYAANIMLRAAKPRCGTSWPPSRARRSPLDSASRSRKNGCAKRRCRAKSKICSNGSKPRPGDTFFIPAGTVHAIGAGLSLCEIQQHSDVTYRLYDYGRPRELHLDHALAVSHRGPHAARAGNVSCTYFATSRATIGSAMGHTSPRETFEMLIAIEGHGEIAGQPMKAGEVWYVAPGTDSFELKGPLTILTVTTG